MMDWSDIAAGFILACSHACAFFIGGLVVLRRIERGER